ncbi:MAG: hypothetical protein QXV69_07240 [Sulfolobaceae archaeon]
MIVAQTHQIPGWILEGRKVGISKTLEVPIGGTTFYFDVPENPLVYVSESNGIIYINGSAYWESELYMLKDLKDEFVFQALELAKTIGKSVIEIKDIVIEFDEKKNVEKRKFYILLEGIEIGFYYKLYLPDGKRNGIIEIAPYAKKLG